MDNCCHARPKFAVPLLHWHEFSAAANEHAVDTLLLLLQGIHLKLGHLVAHADGDGDKQGYYHEKQVIRDFSSVERNPPHRSVAPVKNDVNHKISQNSAGHKGQS